MENENVCLKCTQLSKRIKAERTKHDKKKKLITLFKELLYAHDLKLCNLSRINLRDTYSKYLIDGEQVRQRLAGTLSSLNEITEAYSSLNINNESQQKKIQDLEGRLKHLEFLNKQLSDYYNQTENGNKKQRAESKPRVKREVKKGRKFNVKVEVKSDPSSPSGCVVNDTLDNSDFGFSAETPVKSEEGSKEHRVEDISDLVQVDSNPDVSGLENTAVEQELLKAKDFLDSASICDSLQESFDICINDVDDDIDDYLACSPNSCQLPESYIRNELVDIVSGQNEKTLVDQCAEVTSIVDLANSPNSCQLSESYITNESVDIVSGQNEKTLVDQCAEVTSVVDHDQLISNQSNKFRKEGNLEKIICDEGSSPIDSGIFSSTSSPALSEINEDQNTESFQQKDTLTKCDNSFVESQLSNNSELLKSVCNEQSVKIEKNMEFDGAEKSLNKTIAYSDSTVAINQIMEKNISPEIISPIRSLKKLRTVKKNCKKAKNKSCILFKSKTGKESQNNSTSQIPNRVDNALESNKDDFINEKDKSLTIGDVPLNGDSIAGSDNGENNEATPAATAEQFKDIELSNGNKRFSIQRQCNFPKPKLTLNAETSWSHSDWNSSNANLSWTEELKLQENKCTDYDVLCKSFNNIKLSGYVRRKKGKTSHINKESSNLSSSSIFKSATSNGLKSPLNSAKSVSCSKHWSDNHIFGNIHNIPQENTFTFSNNHENLFSMGEKTDSDFTFSRSSTKSNFSSFYEYRINNTEKGSIKSQQISNRCSTSHTAVTITYKLLCNESGYTYYDEVFKFTFTHPIVKANDLKDTCIKVNSLNELIYRLRQLSDELERLNGMYINKTHINGLPTRGGCYCLYCRESTFSVIPFHQDGRHNTFSEPNCNFRCCNYQMGFSQINPFLMRQCFNSCPSSTYFQENLSTHSQAESCNSSIFRNTPPCFPSTSRANVFYPPNQHYPTNISSCASDTGESVYHQNNHIFENANCFSNNLHSNAPPIFCNVPGRTPEKIRSASHSAASASNDQENANKFNIFSGHRHFMQAKLVENRKKETERIGSSNFSVFNTPNENSILRGQDYLTLNDKNEKQSSLKTEKHNQDISLSSKVASKGGSFKSENDSKNSAKQHLQPVAVKRNVSLEDANSSKNYSGICNGRRELNNLPVLSEMSALNKNDHVKSQHKVKDFQQSNITLPTALGSVEKGNNSAVGDNYFPSISNSPCNHLQLEKICKNKLCDTVAIYPENSQKKCISSINDIKKTSKENDELLNTMKDLELSSEDESEINLADMKCSKSSGHSLVTKSETSLFNCKEKSDSYFKQVTEEGISCSGGKMISGKDLNKSKFSGLSQKSFDNNSPDEKKKENKRNAFIHPDSVKNNLSEVKSHKKKNIKKSSSYVPNSSVVKETLDDMNLDEFNCKDKTKNVDVGVKNEEFIKDVTGVISVSKNKSVMVENERIIKSCTGGRINQKKFKSPNKVKCTFKHKKETDPLNGNLFGEVFSEIISDMKNKAAIEPQMSVTEKMRSIEERFSAFNMALNNIMEEYKIIQPLSPLPPEIEKPTNSLSSNEVLKITHPSESKDQQQSSLETDKEISEMSNHCFDKERLDEHQRLNSKEFDDLHTSFNKEQLPINNEGATFFKKLESCSASEKDNSFKSDSDKTLNNTIPTESSSTTEELPNAEKERKQETRDTEELLICDTSCSSTIPPSNDSDIENNSYLNEKCPKILSLFDVNDDNSSSIALTSVCSQVAMDQGSTNVNDDEKSLVIDNIQEVKITSNCGNENNLVTQQLSNKLDLDNNKEENTPLLNSSSLDISKLEHRTNSTDYITEEEPGSCENKSEDNVKARLRVSSFGPVKRYTRRNSKKLSSPKHLKELFNDELKSSIGADKNNLIMSDTSLKNRNVLTYLESKPTEVSSQSEDKHRLNELYSEVDSLIIVDFKTDTNKSEGETGEEHSGKREDNSALKNEDVNSIIDIIPDNLNQSKNNIFESDDLKECNTLSVGFYRDRTEEEEEVIKLIESQKSTSSAYFDHAYVNNLERGLLFNNSISEESEIVPGKRKYPFNERTMKSKIPRTISQDEIIECKDESAMRTTLRYITDKALLESDFSSGRTRRKILLMEDKSIKSLIDSFIDTSGENSDKLNSLVDELSSLDITSVAKVLLETIVSDKQEMKVPAGGNRMPPLTKIQKRLLMLTLSLAQHNDQVYDEILNSLEEALASFRDKTINVTNGCKMIFFYTVLCRSQGFLSRARSMLFDLLYSRNKKSIGIVLKMVTIWPFIIPLANFSKGCLLTASIIHILQLPYSGNDKTSKREATVLTRNLMTKYGYPPLASSPTKDDLITEILTRITEKGSGLALLLLTKFYYQQCASKLVETALLPRLKDWLNGSCNISDLVVVEITLAVGRIARGFPKLTCRPLINSSIKTLENMLDKANSLVIIEAVVEALALLRRHNLPMCAAALAKWRPKDNIITTKTAELIRSVLTVKPLTHWIRFLNQYDN